MNSNPTEYAKYVDSTMTLVVTIGAIFLIGITATMIYFVFKYNRKKGHKPVDIHGSVLLETIWFVIPTILVLTMFYYGFVGFKEFKEVPKNALEINVHARMWNWDFIYDNGLNLDTLYVPINKTIKLNLTSNDVNHALYIPALRIKQDLISGKQNYLVLKPERLGSYNIACAEYCGLNHSAMYTKLVVLTQDQYDKRFKTKNTTETKSESTK
jgi:cytochrome c oxidase subunit II